MSVEVGSHSKIFVCGKWVPCEASLPVVNPATEQTIGSIPAASAEDAVACVAEAHLLSKAGPWARSSGKERAVYLRAMGAAIRAKRDLLARLESLDMGKPIVESEGDVDDCATAFDFFAMQAERLDARQAYVLKLESPIDSLNWMPACHESHMDERAMHMQDEPSSINPTLTPLTMIQQAG